MEKQCINTKTAVRIKRIESRGRRDPKKIKKSTWVHQKRKKMISMNIKNFY